MSNSFKNATYFSLVLISDSLLKDVAMHLLCQNFHLLKAGQNVSTNMFLLNDILNKNPMVGKFCAYFEI